MFKEKMKLIENLTGVNSSKLNYYVELKKRNEEIIKQNNRLEIINQLVRDINIDMTVKDIIKRVYSKLPLAIPCDFLGLVLTATDELYIKAIMPATFKSKGPVSRESFLWKCFNDGEARIFENVSPDDLFVKVRPNFQINVFSISNASYFVKSFAITLMIGFRPAFLISSILAAFSESSSSDR